MNKSGMLKPAAIGGILMGILSWLPFISYFNCVCCAWIIGGSVLAAYLYVKNSSVAVTLGQGVTLGLLTGAIGTAIVALLSIPILLMPPEGSQGLAEQIRQTMDRIPGFPAESRKEMIELSSREGFEILLYITSVAGFLVLNSLMSMMGGTLGVAIFEKRKQQYPESGAPTAEPPSLPPPVDKA